MSTCQDDAQRIAGRQKFSLAGGRTNHIQAVAFTDFPADFPCTLGDQADTVISRGGSCIINPFGEIIAGPDFAGETIFTAEVDRAQIIRGKFDFDVSGHYARPDVFSLHVDERKKSAVITLVDRSEQRDKTPSDVDLSQAAGALL